MRCALRFLLSAQADGFAEICLADFASECTSEINNSRLSEHLMVILLHIPMKYAEFCKPLTFSIYNQNLSFK